MPPASDPALALLQAAARAPRSGANPNPAAALLSAAAADGPATQPTSSKPANVAQQSLPLQIGPFNTGVQMPVWLSEIAAGSGSKLADWGLGAEQMLGNAAAKLDPSRFGQTPANLDAAAARKRAIDQQLLSTVGGKVGSTVTTMAPALIPGMGGLGALTALGAAQGALQPTTAGESRVLNTAAGGAGGLLGGLAGNAVGGFLARRVGAAIRPALTDAQQAALSQGEALGMRVTPGQALGSKPLQQFEARLQSMPWTSGPFAKLAGANQGALDRVAAQSIGEDAGTVDSQVMGRANDRLGDIFESVRNPSHVVTFDPAGTQGALDAIDSEFKGLLPGNSPIRSQNALVQQLSDLADEGHATAQQLGQLSSKLGKAAFKQMTGTGDRDLGQALYAVKDHVDDLLESSLTGPERAAYAQARQQYRALMQLTSRVGIVNPSTGNVSGAALANKLQQSDRAGFTFGKNTSPLYAGARFAQAFKPIVGDSGTATRSGAHTAMLSAGLLGDAMLRGAPIEHALAEAALPYAAGALGNAGSRAYLSPWGQAGIMALMGAPGALSRGAAAASRFAAPGVRYGLLGAGLNAWPLINSR